eukprot:TRINITY_DN5969_c0_g1_i1.p1 TRINITY_DN5969_c0_g1~~TRINITY_DN5969_c0_g1_i1.p1  ORF type:complete len:514 (+),score=89.50 TRINITY_DN5969_c0_g1_i1:31-1572(+)
MIIKIRGDADAFDRSDELICSINQSASSVMSPQLATRLGRRSLKGLEVWAVMPDGKYKRVDVNARPCDYGITEDDKEWAVFIRSPAIPECPVPAAEEASVSNIITMQWSRHAVYKPRPKRCITNRSLPRKTYTRRLAQTPTAEQQLRALSHYSFVINDGLISRDFASAVLAEAIQVHLRGRLSETVPSQVLPVTFKNETHGGQCCWVNGEHHPAFKRYLRILDSTVSGLNLPLDKGSPCLLSFYPAGGSCGSIHADTDNDSRRMLTATMFLQHPGQGGDHHMLTPTNFVEVAPLLGRVLLHWSDERCKHEIRPTSSQAHYSITVWYCHKDKQAKLDIENKKAKLKRMALMYVIGRACVGAGLVTCASVEQKKKRKKHKKRKSKKKNTEAIVLRGQQEDSSDSDDNWMVFCSALRAALASSVALLVSHTTLPPTTPLQRPSSPVMALSPLPVSSPLLYNGIEELEGLYSSYRQEAKLRRKIEMQMAAHEEEVEDILCAALHAMAKLMREVLPVA